MPGAEPRKMTREEIEQSTLRLSAPNRRKPGQLKPLCASRPISSDEMQASILRLYDEDLERRRNNTKLLFERELQLEQRTNGSNTRKVLSPSDVDGMVERLYHESIENRARVLNSLWADEMRAEAAARSRTATARGSSSLKGEGSKSVGNNAQKTLVERLYTGSITQRNENHIKLFTKYVVDREPVTVLRRQEELMESCHKLHKGEGVTT